MSLKGEDITLSVSSFFNVMYMYTLCDEMSYLIPCANSVTQISIVYCLVTPLSKCIHRHYYHMYSLQISKTNGNMQIKYPYPEHTV